MEFKIAREIVGKYGVQMLGSPREGIGVVAVATKDGRPVVGADDFCVTAFVPRKMSKRELEDAGHEPFDVAFTRAVDGSTAAPPDIDVVESGSNFQPQIGLQVPEIHRGLYGGAPPALNAQKWFSSLRSGIGITNSDAGYPQMLSVGTLGFFMRDNAGDEYLVSNNHVIGRSNDAQTGESVVQPGTLDLTGLELSLMPTRANLNATLKVAEVAGVVQLSFMTPQNIPVNTVDAALARLVNSGRSHTDLARLTYGGGIAGVAGPFDIDPQTGALVGDPHVYKVGRTTGYTEGVVIAVAGTATIPYDGGDAYFADQIVVRATNDNVGAFSDNGDSGSGVLDVNHELVGLLFAGSQRQTLVNPIGNVLDELRQAAQNPDLVVITL